MKSNLYSIAEKFLNSKRNFDYCYFCNNGIKKATFTRYSNGYLTCDIKEYNPYNKRFEYVESTSVDIMHTIKQELNQLPIKPIAIFRGNRKHNLTTN